MPNSRQRLFQIISLLIGVGLLGVFELSLRITGQFDPQAPAPGLPDDWSTGGIPAAGQIQRPLLSIKNGFVEPSTYGQGYMKTPRFNIESNQKRILSFGGSATLGVPVENTPNKTFPGQLAQQLSKLSVSSESINLGGASFGSEHVIQLVQESQSLNADALIVYSGNNEYFNFGLALLEKNRGYQSGKVYLQSLHLFRMIQTLIGNGPVAIPFNTQQLKFKQDQRLAILIQGMMQAEEGNISIQNGLVRRNDTLTNIVKERYVDNLQSAVDLSGSRPIFIGEVPPNLFESPWLSLHKPSLSIAKREEFAEQLSLLNKLPCKEALEKWKTLVQIDNWRADAWYGLGMCQYDLSLPFERSLRNALELDMNPGRPTAALNNGLKELENAELVRFDAFNVESDFGREFFHDSCHLTPRGYSIVAETFRNALIAQGWGL